MARNAVMAGPSSRLSGSRYSAFAESEAAFIHTVMAGLVPVIHVFTAHEQDVDARAKRAHDE